MLYISDPLTQRTKLEMRRTEYSLTGLKFKKKQLAATKRIKQGTCIYCQFQFRFSILASSSNYHLFFHIFNFKEYVKITVKKKQSVNM